jgi:glutathione-regulated potassium-efflux system ancillary protein KefC
MDFEWIAIALGDVVWIVVAFAMGALSRAVGLPPLVGFLAAGFLLNTQGIAGGETLEKLSDLGVTLLLFIVGLKLNLATLGRPQVWAVAGIHMCAVVALFGFAIYGLALLGASFVDGLDLGQSMLIAFALSFSSTVFAVKTLEERGEMASLHGRIAIGILIMQDLAAVVFLAISVGKVPSSAFASRAAYDSAADWTWRATGALWIFAGAGRGRNLRVRGPEGGPRRVGRGRHDGKSRQGGRVVEEHARL